MRRRDLADELELWAQHDHGAGGPPGPRSALERAAQRQRRHAPQPEKELPMETAPMLSRYDLLLKMRAMERRIERLEIAIDRMQAARHWLRERRRRAAARRRQ